MKLESVEINNFRSIKELTLDIDESFQILVGINESGKSNILSALSYLSNDVEINRNDIRDPLLNEENIESSYISFRFRLDEEDKKVLKKRFDEKILQTKRNELIVESVNEKDTFTLKGFIDNNFSHVFYTVDLLGETDEWEYDFPIKADEHRVKNENFKLLNDSAPVTLSKNNISFDTNSYEIVNKSDFPELDVSHTEDLCISDVENILVDTIESESILILPEVIKWEYKEENLLPGRIELNSFKNNPDSCRPLKHMFLIAGINEIKEKIEQETKRTNGLKNLFRKVSFSITEYLHQVWPEWGDISIVLSQNGNVVEAGVQDTDNFYDLSRRSDGFKRFFTFLLMVSSQSIKNHISNQLILIDEPDIALHPSGVSYLREELIKASKNNLILASTHSIFMVDKKNINRHLLVSKNNEKTDVARVESGNFSDEEVIYKALNFSLYELIKEKNLIFEGWTDQHIFKKIYNSKKYADLYGDDQKIIKKIGLLHSYGVKDIPNIATTCDNFSRQYAILSDSDAVSRRDAFNGKGEWKVYTDFENVEAITIEDFIKNTYINNSLKKVLKSNGIGLTVQLSQDLNKNKIEHIRKKLTESGVLDNNEARALLRNIKVQIAENITVNDLNEDVLKIAHLMVLELSEGQINGE